MTTVHELQAYEDKLYGCRFCPMCKPAGEVSNLTMLEGHTTRARAMMLWRLLHGMLSWDPRSVEQLYQSTLDSISESWCVSHYPVSGYMLAARAQVYEAGLAPDAVQRVVNAVAPAPSVSACETLLLASEVAALNGQGQLQPALDALQQAGTAAEPVLLPSGAVPYSLGARAVARDQAERVLHVVRESGARRVIADGPQTLWALTRIYPALGVELPAGVEVVSLAEVLARSLNGQRPGALAGTRVFFHDSRAAAALATSLAKAPAIQPGYVGPEDTLGQGEVYETPRRLLDALGAERAYSVWSRSLSRSDGSDDGLWQTYPDLAAGLARQRLAHIRSLGVSMIVTDSPLSAAQLGQYAAEFGQNVRWLPALFPDGNA